MVRTDENAPATAIFVAMQTKLADIFQGGRRLRLAAGSTLFRAGDQVREMFIVCSGCVELQRHTRTGGRLVLSRAGTGAILAEASAYSDRYHCDAVAAETSLVLSVPTARFRAFLADHPAMAEIWARTLARGVQAARLRAEIRSLTRVSERLDAWLDAGNTLPEKGRLQDVAAEISVSREALYRELARRRGRPGGDGAARWSASGGQRGAGDDDGGGGTGRSAALHR